MLSECRHNAVSGLLPNIRAGVTAGKPEVVSDRIEGLGWWSGRMMFVTVDHVSRLVKGRCHRRPDDGDMARKLEGILVTGKARSPIGTASLISNTDCHKNEAHVPGLIS